MAGLRRSAPASDDSGDICYWPEDTPLEGLAPAVRAVSKAVFKHLKKAGPEVGMDDLRSAAIAAAERVGGPVPCSYPDPRGAAP